VGTCGFLVATGEYLRLRHPDLFADDKLRQQPSGAFKSYAGVSTAILLFTKTTSGGTDQVWFYDVEADGWSLDDKRQPLLPDEKLGPVPTQPLTSGEHSKNNLPEVLARWGERDKSDRQRTRVEQSFCVPRLIWCREERKPMARMPASFCPDFGIHTLPSIKKAMNLHSICTAVIGFSGNVLRTRRLLIYVHRL
jgi:hypothetical protein